MGKYDELVGRLRGDDYTCPENMGCGTMKFCACGTMDEAATAIATLEAEVGRLAEAWKLQHKEKEKERAEAKLWFERAQKWRAELAAMKTRGDRLAEFAVHKRECLIVKVWWQAGNCQCGLTQALTGWRDHHHGGNDADT